MWVESGKHFKTKGEESVWNVLGLEIVGGGGLCGVVFFSFYTVKNVGQALQKRNRFTWQNLKK